MKVSRRPRSSPCERGQRHPLRSAHEGLGDAKGRPDVRRAGEQEHPRRALSAGAGPVDPGLDRGQQGRRLLELVDAEGQCRVLDESSGVLVGRRTGTVVVEGHVSRTPLLGHRGCERALAGLARAYDDRYGRVVEGCVESGFDMSPI